MPVITCTSLAADEWGEQHSAAKLLPRLSHAYLQVESAVCFRPVIVVSVRYSSLFTFLTSLQMDRKSLSYLDEVVGSLSLDTIVDMTESIQANIEGVTKSTVCDIIFCCYLPSAVTVAIMKFCWLQFGSYLTVLLIKQAESIVSAYVSVDDLILIQWLVHCLLVNCTRYGTAVGTGLQSVRDCRRYGTAGGTGLYAVRDCTRCGTVRGAGLQAVQPM